MAHTSLCLSQTSLPNASAFSCAPVVPRNYTPQEGRTTYVPIPGEWAASYGLLWET
jgi:hypothetical protein